MGRVGATARGDDGFTTGEDHCGPGERGKCGSVVLEVRRGGVHTFGHGLVRAVGDVAHSIRRGSGQSYYSGDLSLYRVNPGSSATPRIYKGRKTSSSSRPVHGY